MTIHAALTSNRRPVSPLGRVRSRQPRHDRGNEQNARQDRERDAVIEILPMHHVEEEVPVQTRRSTRPARPGRGQTA